MANFREAETRCSLLRLLHQVQRKVNEMQNEATFKTVTRNGTYLLVLAAVAAAGVSVGRWVVPEDSGAAPSISAEGQPAPVSVAADPMTLDGPAVDLAALNGVTGELPPIVSRAADPFTLDGPAIDLAALGQAVPSRASVPVDPFTLDGPAIDLAALKSASPARLDPGAKVWTLDGPPIDLAAVGAASRRP